METVTTSPSGVLEEIGKANRQFEQKFASGDARGIASLYTMDGCVLPPGATTQQGTEAIATFWKMAMDMGIKAAQLETVQLEAEGDTAVEIGRYSLTGEGGKHIDEGKYLVVWKKQSGQWRLHKDIWNTSLSPAS
jgi:uncharacterized protein (TIGR02246 family)